jgi:hypothetical protein
MAAQEPAYLSQLGVAPSVKLRTIDAVDPADIVVWHRMNERRFNFEQQTNETAALARLLHTLYRLGVRQYSMRDTSNDAHAQVCLESVVENNLSIEWPLVTFRGVMIGATAQLEALLSLQTVSPLAEQPVDLSDILAAPIAGTPAGGAEPAFDIIYATSSDEAKQILQREVEHPTSRLAWISSLFWYTASLFWRTDTAATEALPQPPLPAAPVAAGARFHELLQWNWYGREQYRTYAVQEGQLCRYLPDRVTIRAQHNLLEIAAITASDPHKITISFVNETNEYINGDSLPLIEDLVHAVHGEVSIVIAAEYPAIPLALLHRQASRLLAYIRAHFLREEGIFRINGSVRAVGTLTALAIMGSPLDEELLRLFDGYTICDSLKRLFRCHCESPLVSPDLYLDIRMFSNNPVGLDTAVKLRLTPAHQLLLNELFGFLVELVAEAPFNKVSVDNAITLFAPSILAPPHELPQEDTKTYTLAVLQLFGRLFRAYIASQVAAPPPRIDLQLPGPSSDTQIAGLSVEFPTPELIPADSEEESDPRPIDSDYPIPT